MTTRPDLRSGAERRSLESIAMTMSWVVGAALPVVSRPVRAVRLTERARNLRATHRWSRRHCTRRRIGERVDNPRGQIDGPPEDGACCFPFIRSVGHRRHLLLAEQGACRWVEDVLILDPIADPSDTDSLTSQVVVHRTEQSDTRDRLRDLI